MKILRQGVALLLSVAMSRADDSFFDRLEQALTHQRYAGTGGI
jgi:hypothetical protein